MTQPERTIFSTSEQKLTGVSLVGSSENDRIRVEKFTVDDNTMRYEVTGKLKIGRSAISAIMTTPLRGVNVEWQAVRDGLREISRPTRHILEAQKHADKRIFSEEHHLLGRETTHRTHLQKIGPAAKELADIMLNNQAYRRQSTNAPIFTASESLAYANDEIMHHMDADEIVFILQNIGLNTATAKQLTEFAQAKNQTDDVVKELEAVTGFSVEELHQVENSAILKRVDSGVVAELTYRLQEMLFIGFAEQATYDNREIHHGDNQNSVFLLESDVPAHIVASALRTSVEVIRKVRAADRKTERDRYKVDFLVDAPKISATPRIVWEKRGDERYFVYPSGINVQDYDPDPAEPIPNSVLGAALAANYASDKYPIPYAETLNKRLHYHNTHHSSRSFLHTTPYSVRLLPLVLNLQENTLLQDGYFTSIEQALK